MLCAERERKRRKREQKICRDLCVPSPNITNTHTHTQTHTRRTREESSWRIEEGCNEVRLLHGIKPALVMSILQNGMNERFAGASVGTMLAGGSYSTDDAGKIDQYVDVDQQYDGTALPAQAPIQHQP